MNKASQKHEAPEVTFARDLGLFEATMIGVGAMIGAGIFVLTGIAAGEAGPASILAFSLNGVVTLLTAFAYAELASAIPRAGGGYSYVRMAFPGGVGFIAGWMLWFAYVVACSLYALGFASYFLEFFARYLPGFTREVVRSGGEHSALLLVTLLVGIAFIWLNARGAAVTGKAENALTSQHLSGSVPVQFPAHCLVSDKWVDCVRVASLLRGFREKVCSPGTAGVAPRSGADSNG